jgi:hypothetical protein
MAKKTAGESRSSASTGRKSAEGRRTKKTVISKLGNTVTRAANGTKILLTTTGAKVFKKVTQTATGVKVTKYRYDAKKGKR